MSTICIGGCCIPLAMLWPIALLFLKQVWEYFYPKKVDEAKKPSITTDATVEVTDKTPCCCDPADALDCSKGSVDFKNGMNWNDLTNSSTTLVVRFTAPWCKPCKEIAPLFDEISRSKNGRANFVSVDVDTHDELAAALQVVAIPLFLCYRNGNVLGRYAGKEEAKVREHVDKWLTAQ